MIAPGLWRNLCPLGTTSLLPRHLGINAQRDLSPAGQSRFALIGTVTLLLMIPFQHVALATHGPTAAAAIALLVITSIVVGSQFRWKSAWCAGLCPVHQVEKLYGTEPAVTFANAHCHRCEDCPLGAARERLLAGNIMVGGFPGFVWGWFHVRDYAWPDALHHIGVVYAFPFAGLAVTLTAFLILNRLMSDRYIPVLRRAFAASAIGCYYWFRIPALIGFGPFPGDGMLIDLTTQLPAWTPHAMRAVTTLFCAWWFCIKPRQQRSWLKRPPPFEPVTLSVSAATT